MSANDRSETPTLKACPFCGAQINVGRHTAFHPPRNDCWLGNFAAGEPIELDECFYDEWNRRADSTEDERAVLTRIERELKQHDEHVCISDGACIKAEVCVEAIREVLARREKGSD